VFSDTNDLLGDHPIIWGRNAAEAIQRLLKFTGQSVLGPPAAVRLLSLSPTAVEYPPTSPKMDRSDGNVRVSMGYGTPISVRGGARGVALEAGEGRIVILGEAGMFRAQRGSGGGLVGMNATRYDNRQLALNVMRWLSRLL